MRHAPRFSDDYGFSGSYQSNEDSGNSPYAMDFDELLEACGGDLSLDIEEVDVELLH